ncbi:hypothetical protein K2173_026620 [Erythroxylum novogranatense]|uniref:DUF4378 domain-containing protein n=1 Tax=Erythroxylum novogranatense TaxID=1862640 RepID=A0AAV8TZ85_9ROSI|nr:hypothetical protein K2173_026620 [Erythroxylum novogranatense]
MRRDRYLGGGKSSKRGGRRVGDGDAVEDGGGTPASGCMCSIFQLFDFHPFHFANLHQQTSLKPNSSIPRDNDVSKGIEVPRNNLELKKPNSLPSSVIKEDDDLAISIGIQVRTNGGTTWKATNDCCSSDISSSQGAKSPNLVARLMGLDVLPDSYSPRSSSSSSSNLGTSGNMFDLHHHVQARRLHPHKSVSPRSSSYVGDHFTGCRSLPETPRISSARRSDVDYHHQHHRLSLQIYKENTSKSEEVVMSRVSSLQRKENRTTSHHARQIVKQVKGSVGRKVGLDITNTVSNREQGIRDELVSQPKSRKISKVLIKKVDESSSGKQCTSSSSSPKFKILEPKNEKLLKKHPQTSNSLRKKQTEPFVRATIDNVSEKKFKKTPLSKNVTVSDLLPVKKDPSPPATRISQKQLSSCSSHSYKQQQILEPRDMKNNGDTHLGFGNTTATGDNVAAEYHDYITRILRCTGIGKDTSLSFVKWFSPSNPLNPSTFYHLEFETSTTTTSTTTTTTNRLGNYSHQLGQRWNRKLLFHLVDEMLVEILRPYINLKPWTSSARRVLVRLTKGSNLVDELCSKVGSFRGKNCQVLEDIDAIIDKDPRQLKIQSEVGFDQEVEGIVSRLEKGLLDMLIHETAVILYGCD